MNGGTTLLAASLLGFAAGAAAVQALHAQAAPPAYYVAEIDVADIDNYERDYVPKVKESIKSFGGQTLVSGRKITAVEGPAPKRVAVVKFESLDTLLAWRNSAQYKQDRMISDKYGTVRAYAVQGLAE